MKTLHVIVSNNKATFSHRDGNIICGNADYQIQFHFDSEWSAHESKTARFIWGGKHKDVVFTGNVCPVPIVANTKQLEVGVYVENLSTSTPAKIPCERSILCKTLSNDDGTVIIPDNAPVLLEKTITENGTYTPGDDCDGFSKVTVQVAETVGTATAKDWQAGVVYNPGEIVIYNGEYYVCIKTTQGFLDDPEHFPDEWECISGGGYKGPYDYGTAYKAGDVVTFEGDAYLCMTDCEVMNSPVDHPMAWQQLNTALNS